MCLFSGFGALRNVQLESDQLRELQENLIRSHAAGVGDPLGHGRVEENHVLIIRHLLTKL